MPTKVTNEILTAAIEGFEAQKTKLNAQIAKLRETLSGGPVKPAVAPEPLGCPSLTLWNVQTPSSGG